MQDNFTAGVSNKQIALQCTKCKQVFFRDNGTNLTPDALNALLDSMVQTESTQITGFGYGQLRCPTGHDSKVLLYKKPPAEAKPKEKKPLWNYRFEKGR